MNSVLDSARQIYCQLNSLSSAQDSFILTHKYYQVHRDSLSTFTFQMAIFRESRALWKSFCLSWVGGKASVGLGDLREWGMVGSGPTGACCAQRKS